MEEEHSGPEARKGIAISGAEVMGLIERDESTYCAAFVAADIRSIVAKRNAVVMAMGTAEGSVAAHLILECSHSVEMVIDHLRKAAKDAFEHQPCTDCES